MRDNSADQDQPTRQFHFEAVRPLLGENAGNLSENVGVRLKESWSQEYAAWNRRDLSDKHYVYVWADGIHPKIRLETEERNKQCLLVLEEETASGFVFRICTSPADRANWLRSWPTYTYDPVSQNKTRPTRPRFFASDCACQVETP